MNAVYLLNKISGGQTISKASSVLSLQMNAAERMCTQHTRLVAELSTQVLVFDPMAVLVGFIMDTLGPRQPYVRVLGFAVPVCVH